MCDVVWCASALSFVRERAPSWMKVLSWPHSIEPSPSPTPTPSPSPPPSHPSSSSRSCCSAPPSSSLPPLPSAARRDVLCGSAFSLRSHTASVPSLSPAASQCVACAHQSSEITSTGALASSWSTGGSQMRMGGGGASTRPAVLQAEAEAEAEEVAAKLRSGCARKGSVASRLARVGTAKIRMCASAHAAASSPSRSTPGGAAHWSASSAGSASSASTMAVVVAARAGFFRDAVAAPLPPRVCRPAVAPAVALSTASSDAAEPASAR